MASVYDHIRGEQLERLIALHVDVQASLDKHAGKVLKKAEQKLSEHKDTGNAHVGLEEGDIDRYVFLEDPDSKSGVGAAMSIEYGHMLRSTGRLGDKKERWVEGLWILHDAAGMPRPR